MEFSSFTSYQIARLVLGYLKTEKCHLAFDTFYKTSPHFHSSNNSKTRTKYIVTRVMGKSLYDFLNEYAHISKLIQERLEPTQYYEENSSLNIVDQLTYLLDRTCHTTQTTPQGSRSSTPVKEGHINKCLFNQNLSIIEEDVTPDLTTTPLDSLPGNSKEYSRNNKRKGIKTNKNTAVEESDSGDCPDNCQDDTEDIKVLRNTLLEHTELHEKIAEHINVVRSTSETTKTEEKLANELDNAIKSVLERTEADPIFEKLIGDLIGAASDNDEIDQQVQELTESEERENLLSDTKKLPLGNLDTDSYIIKHKQDSRKESIPTTGIENGSDASTEIKTSCPKEDTPSTNENIQKSSNAEQSGRTKVDFHQNLTVNTNAGDIILYDGTLDNYVKNTASVPGLLQQTTLATPMVTGLQVDKPLYVLNSSQLINVSVPQYKFSNVTEQDILTMPTVIVCDDNRQSRPPAVPTYPKELKKILPKETPESNLSEYLTLYKSSESPALQSDIKHQAKKKDNTLNSIHIEILKQPESENAKPITAESQVTPRPVTPEAIKQSSRKTTPKSGSHVRALDFNFNTPGHSSVSAKKICTTPKSPKKKSPGKVSSAKISKSLFGSPSKSIKSENGTHERKEEQSAKRSQRQTKSSSWDADLRALMGPVKDPTPKKKKKDCGKKCSRKPKPNLNKTETDAKVIEENLKKMELEIEPSDPVCEPKERKEETKKEDCIKEEIEKVPEEVKTVSEDDPMSEFTVALINCNAKSRFRKKCNIDNSISKSVKITKVKEIKSLEIIPDTNNKLILSPSKLNANKRTLVDNIDKEVSVIVIESVEHVASTKATIVNEKNNEDVQQNIAKDMSMTASNADINGENKTVNENSSENGQNDSIENKSTENGDKFITPEMPKDSITFPISANRNLTPMLETPIKIDSIPKTPGKYLPIDSTDTPMTKLLNEQLHGVDILSIPTPNFPLTPSFPFTPFNTKSPYPNRSTDYSTTSSYYQPSDSEQNKSFEALLEECKRLEGRDFKTNTKCAESTTPDKNEQNEIEEKVRSSISEKISSFNQNMIGRKNLSLVKKDLENSSCESSSDAESSMYSDNRSNTSDSLFNNSGNSTVVEKNMSSSRYSLRSRKKEETPPKCDKGETIQDIVSQTEIKSELKEDSAVNAKDAILKEIEEKRKRTIAIMKQVQKPTPAKKKPIDKTPRPLPNRNNKGKFIKSASNKKRRKSKSPMKVLTKTTVSEDTKDVMLHISSDDDNIKPYDVVETQLLENSSDTNTHPLNTFQKALDSLKSNLKTKETSDIVLDPEAAILVEGLKERGIYLVPNKTPRKQAKPSRLSVDSVDYDKNIEAQNVKPKDQHIDNKEESIKTNKVNEISNVSSINSGHSELKLNPQKVENESKNIGESSLADHVHAPNTELINEMTNKEKVRTNKKDDTNLKNKKQKKTKIVNPDSKANVIGDKTKDTITKTNVVPKNSTKDKTLNKDRKEQIDLKSDSSKKSTKSSKTTTKNTNNQSNKSNIKNSASQHSIKIESSNENVETIKPDDLNKSNLLNVVSAAIEDSISHEQNHEAPSSNDKLTSNIEQDLNLTDSFSNETFDNKLFAEETLKIVYDENKTCGKKLSDYDLSILDKRFVVEVFGQKIELSAAPLDMILNIPEKRPKDKIKILEDTLISTGSDKKLVIETSSPLENLYSDSPSRYPSSKVQKLKHNDRRRNSVDQKYDSKPTSKRNTRSKSVDHNSLLTIRKQCDNVKIPNKTDKAEKALDIKDNNTSNVDTKKKDIKDVAGTPNTSKSSPKEIDDDLMNYAICGSEREENDTGDTSKSNKRKAQDDEDVPSKKFKVKELIDNVDFDVFLTQIHGKK